jgi:hypothetical protein
VVRPWIALLLTAGAVALGVRHALGHRHFVLIPLLLVPALVLGWYEYQFRSDQNMFSAIGTRIAEREVTIECQRLGGAMLDVTSELGYVQFDAANRPADVGRLEIKACEALRSYTHSSHESPTLDEVVAVQVLTHESYHLSGIRSESEAECKALQRLDEVAVWLGATVEQARALADRYWAEVYPRMPDGYRSNDCVDGGRLDVAPSDVAWP